MISRIAATVILLAGAAGAARAGTIVDTFGAGQTYDTTQGDTVNYSTSSFNPGESLAEAVDPAADGIITNIAAAFFYLGSGNPTAGLTLSLRAGTASGPTTSLWSTSFTPTATSQVFNFSGLSIQVTGGSFYWLVAATADPTGYGWNLNNRFLASPNAYYATSTAPTTWTAFSDVLAYSVTTGTPVPEPATLPILGAGALLTVLATRRPRRG